jgi:hypothetical protein
MRSPRRHVKAVNRHRDPGHRATIERLRGEKNVGHFRVAPAAHRGSGKVILPMDRNRMRLKGTSNLAAGLNVAAIRSRLVAFGRMRLTFSARRYTAGDFLGTPCADCGAAS